MDMFIMVPFNWMAARNILYGQNKFKHLVVFI